MIRKRARARFSFLVLIVFLTSCAPANLGELRTEGEAEMKKLTAELKRLESPEDIQKASNRLKKRFNRIADLLIQTRNFPPLPGDSLESSRAGEELFAELARIYEIPGGRDAIEAAESEAVRHLDRVKPNF
jgi:hypothetical protein